MTTLLATVAAAGDSGDVKPVIDKARREVRFTATVQPGAMARPFGVEGHHAIVWKGGKASFWALFSADANDHDVRVALDALGAKRGENLSEDSWNARNDPGNPEPDKRVDGAPIDVLIEWQGSNGRRPLALLLAEKGRPAPLLDFRYGGNERFQKDFKSGCIVCLYSCPGGVIGNHVHPIRDYVRDGAVYTSLAQKLPPSGTKVTIILKLKLEGP
ncbi:MAG TPA: YdjY domain-containing protein [Thermoanaerobaculia bacterium]|nr:YdjY domain-containing protein [Thermoanaerobaculia bacterium]